MSSVGAPLPNIQSTQPCPCGSQQSYGSCCMPVIAGDSATSPEALMRSRYSAFFLGNMQYVYRTYSARAQLSLNPADFQSADDNSWCGLQILGHSDNTVEFIAYFREGKTLCSLHELSVFVNEAGKWRYDSGTIKHHGPTKYNRNAACICGSGKKFKRCCQPRLFA